MNRDFTPEPERYELHAAPVWSFEVDRRQFLRTLGGGLVVLCLSRDVPAQQESGRRRGGRGGGQVPRQVEAWLHIDPDGTVTACTGKVEVGQNARTNLTQAVADELRLDPAAVRLIMGDTARVPFDMGTFGSRTTPTMVPQLRRAAAAARSRLVAAAAKGWGVEPDTVEVGDGKVKHPPSDRSAPFGELARALDESAVIDDDTPIHSPADWTVAGKPIPKVDGRAYVTGAHEYASDIRRPGMLRGKVLRPPAYGAELTSLTTRDAEAIDGVTVVRDGQFVGIAAPDEPTASRALAALRAEWKTIPHPSDRDLPDYFKREPGDVQRPDRRDEKDGDLADAFRLADVMVDASYPIAYIAHAPLEPRAAVAEWDGDTLTVWTGTQRPFGVRGELAQAFGLSEDKVRVIVPDTGSGYGGKHSGEAAVEAARLAKAAGRPVKLVWTRPEEFTWAYFRPGGLIEAKAGARNDGTLVAWEFHNYNSGGSGIETPYEVAARRVAFHPAKSPLRQGSYRGLAATANHFARESLMDELAHKLGRDPLEFRLQNLKDERLRAVLKAAADRFGWEGAKSGDGRGVGLAIGAEKGGYVATCAEVEARDNPADVRVVRLVTAFECGAVVNPVHLANQVEGAVIMGLGGLFEAIKFADGQIQNARFARYRVPRFGDTPKIETVLVDRKDLPSAGAGETPIVAVAPAVANALFAATGRRSRSLPLT